VGRTQAEASGGNLLSPSSRQMLTKSRLSRYRLRRNAKRDSRSIPKLGARRGHRDKCLLADFYFLGFITWFGLRVHLFVLTCHMMGCVLGGRFVQIFTEMACTICRMDFVYEWLMDYEVRRLARRSCMSGSRCLILDRSGYRN
jgi:hypothetical protein